LNYFEVRIMPRGVNLTILRGKYKRIPAYFSKISRFDTNLIND